MLIRFSTENFLSFGEEIEFSMLPGKSRKFPNHIISNGKRSNPSVLKTSVIYGANASGKSNLIKAMDFARDIIVGGQRPRQRIAVKPFRFNIACENKPSKFQFEFKNNGKSFVYGFILDTHKIHEEWLYQITTSTEKLIFERKTDSNDKTEVQFANIKSFTSEDQDFLKFTAMGTRPNQLFLTESIERGINYYEDVYNWFDRILVLIFPEARLMGLEVDFMKNQDFKYSLQEFLQFLDTGISGIRLEKFDFDKEISIPEEIKSQIEERVSSLEDDTPLIVSASDGRNYLFTKGDTLETTALKLMTEHYVKGEERTVFLEVTEESDGTQRLFHLIPAIMELLTGERVIVIDEFDRSLHPHLSHKLLEIFLNNKTEQKSQLIVTTHESSLLDLELLRRDEIWFVEKDNDGVSKIYSLEEFAPRYDRDIQKGYLLGRFGAIPFIKDTSNLGWLK